MPIPPIGDMAWAASPIAEQARAVPARQPVERDGRADVTSSQLVERVDRAVELGRGRGDLGAERRRCPRARIASAAPLGKT